MSAAAYTVRPPADPPTGSLPPIPGSKPPRKSLPVSSRLKPPRASTLAINNGQSMSTPDLPSTRSSASTSANPPPSTSPVSKKTVSISNFPQPPAVASTLRTPQLGTSFSLFPHRPSDGRSTPVNNSSAGKSLTKIKTASTSSLRQPSSYFGAGMDGKSVSVPQPNRLSDPHSSIHSPAPSRSSSANGSYSTSATTYEEGEENIQAQAVPIEEPAMELKTTSKGKEAKGNVVVSVRVRPDIANPDNDQSDGEWMVDGRRALVAYRGKEGGDYLYDNVFSPHDDNAKVYDAAAKRLVRRVMEGYHGTVFAYGMTGTGKTFSMQGTMTSPGVIPLAITDIFSYIRETPHREFLLRVSYLEIYNEKIYDLLSGPVAGQSEEIKLREDPKRGVYASPLKEEIVQSPTQLLRVIHRGDMARRTGSTQYNARSSRSHAVVQIVVESRERIAGSGTVHEGKRVAMLPSGVRVSTLSLIDLAGSERAADDKERRQEGAHINKSLLTLGTVIARLSGNRDKNGNPTDKDGKHLPYRDSKLTRLLQPALAGTSLISILCTIQIGSHGSTAPASNHTGETLNTLKFASRAKNNIISHAKRAVEEVGGGVSAALLDRYRAEIASLRSQLEGQQKTNADSADDEVKKVEKDVAQRHEEQMLEMQLARTALKERIEHLNRLILCSKSTGVNSRSVSALGTHARLSGGTTTGDYASVRSIRSSASQSTIGGQSLKRPSAAFSLAESATSMPSPFSPTGEGEDEDGFDYGEGRASFQAQVRALQSDLQDKNRYISTLERRLLQARRSSHSRTSLGFSRPGDEVDVARQMVEKDAQIADLQKTVAALRSAMRKRELAEMNTTTPRSSNASLASSKQFTEKTNSSPPLPTPPTQLERQPSLPLRLDGKNKSTDEMSRMLDEMIQDKVETGHLVVGRTGSVRIPPRSTSTRHSRRHSSSISQSGVPTIGSLAAALRSRDSSTSQFTTLSH